MSNTTNFGDGCLKDTVALGGAYLVVGVLVMLANSVVVFVVVKTRELHLPALWVITFMGVCDFFMGCFITVFYMPSAFSRRFVYPDSMKPVSFSIHLFLLGQTLFNIALAGLDRYIATGWPLKYVNIVTTRRFIAVVVFTVILGVCRIGFMASTGFEMEYNPYLAMSLPAFTNSTSAMGIRMSGVLVTPLVTFGVIVFCFLRIVCKVFLRPVLPHGSSVIQPRLKTSLMALVPTCTFCVSYIPVSVCVILLITGVKTDDICVWLKCSVVALFSNSFWNVLIYTATYRPFRRALARNFCYSNYRIQCQKEVLNTYKRNPRT